MVSRLSRSAFICTNFYLCEADLKSIEQIPYPTRHGLPVPLGEVDIPTTRWDGDHYENNHHLAWTAREMGKLAITQSLRDLEAYQSVVPIAQHVSLHKTYSPPNISLESAYDRVHEAYDNEEYLRLGTAHNFVLAPITPAIIAQCDREWRGLRKLA